MHATRYFFLALGWLSVGLGIIGVIMPILPTTPFLLVAVWAFSKSSPELAEKIRAHKVFGPYVRDWQDHGAIPATAKMLAVVMMTVASVYLVFYSHAPQWFGIGAAVIMAGVAVYIVTRPNGAPPA